VSRKDPNSCIASWSSLGTSSNNSAIIPFLIESMVLYRSGSIGSRLGSWVRNAASGTNISFMTQNFRAFRAILSSFLPFTALSLGFLPFEVLPLPTLRRRVASSILSVRISFRCSSTLKLYSFRAYDSELLMAIHLVYQICLPCHIHHASPSAQEQLAATCRSR
jgi:hypothetical protein